MKLQEFNNYSIEERAEAIEALGTFLAVRTECDCSVCLFYMRDFFAEAWYDPENNEAILIRGFEGRILLEPYLEMIDVSELVNQ
ncbi:hypothetical protein [Pontibacter harenae]|uniref:hypothetical protein n=1 Tax=Pontibacter harenae TaxID=2894083 RepID=UPI001E39FA28|nr:hypothetical protein [Pontibacter harenae]MCC9165213.1 hypothetical protein [Pontibacter harenae]